MEHKNYGIDLGKERAEQDGTEWKFGSILTSLFKVPESEREKSLPKGEVQRSNVEDMQDCATRSPTNELEEQFNYALQNGLLHSDSVNFLERHEYMEEGRVVFADAYNAILSGTTRQGNSLKAPLDTIRKHGMVPKKLLPLLSNMTWEQYHDPKRITKHIREIGEEFAKRFTVNYEQVYASQFKSAMPDGAICVAAFAWPEPVNGTYKRVNAPPNHAFLLFKNEFYAFDNYHDSYDSDFIKRLAPDYLFFDWGYRIAVTAQKTTDEIISSDPLWQKALQALYDAISTLKESLFPPAPPPINEPVKPVNPIPKEALLNGFAMAIKENEDFVPPGGRYRNGKIAPNGSLTWRCNNPGACRFSRVGYLPKYGIVTEYKEGLNLKPGQRGFAKFSNLDIGWMYLKNLILQKAKENPDWDILDFCSNWAPASDNNNPVQYAEFVAKKMGVAVSWRISSLV